MAVTDQQKIDFLLKKIGFTKTKTGSVVGTGAISGTGKQPFAEAIPSPLVVPNSSLWNEAGSIPATAPGSDTPQVKVYLAGTSGLRMTADATSSGQRAYIAYTTYNDTSSARLTNWIDTQFGASYLIKVYKGDPNSGGVALSAAGSGSNDGWFFDYSAGVLNFNDTSVPSGVTDTNIYIVGYRYIGQTGAPTSGISTFSNLDLTVERNLDVGKQGGISTFRHNVQLLDNDKLQFGDSQDLEIYHDTSSSHIKDTGTGELILNSNEVRIKNAADNETMARFIENGAAELWFDNSKKIETTNTGVSITGNSVVSGNVSAVDATFSGNVSIGGTLTYEDVKNVDSVGIVTARSGIRIPNNTGKLELGSSQQFDLSINGSGEALINTTGVLNLATTSFRLRRANGSAYLMNADQGAGLYLYFNGSERLRTTNTGIRVGTGATIETNGQATFTGIVTATTFKGDGDFVDIDVDGHTNLDNVSVAGVTTFSGIIEGVAGENKIPSLYAAMGNLPSAGSYHGMFAHVHATGRGYFAHAGNWLELVNRETNGVVGTGTETYSIGNLVSTSSTATSLNVTGVTTAVTVDINGDLDVDGHTNLDNVNIVGVATVNGEITFPDYSNPNNRISFGDSQDFKIWHTGSNAHINNSTGHLYIQGTPGNNYVYIAPAGGGAALARFDMNGSGARLYSNGATRLLTQSDGVRTIGTLQADNLNVTGVTTTVTVDVNGDLDVDGHTNLDNVSIAGVTTFAANARFNSTIGVHDGTTGGNGQYLRATGTGVTWGSFPTMRTSQTFTASSGQTSFSFTYNVGYLDVFVNGVKLSSSEFTANNGSTVVLSVGSFVGDIVELVSYFTTSYAAGESGITELVQDPTPQLGGNLDLFNKTVEGTGDINMTGVVTATKFVGDGSSLTGIVASGSGVVVKNSGTLVGTAGTIDFGANLSVTPVSAGIVTITGAAGGGGSGSGISTISGVVNIVNDLDVDGHTNLDNVSIVGVATVTGALRIPDGAKNGNRISVGDSEDLKIYHNGGHNYIDSVNGNLTIRGANDENAILYTANGSIELFHDSVKRFETSSVGVSIPQDLDVDGHTNLDNVSVAGVTTFASSITASDIRSDSLNLKNAAGGATYAIFTNGGSALLKHNNTDRLETSASGVTVTGTVAATSYTGDGSNLTGIVAGTATNATNFTVTTNNVTDETVYPVFVDGTSGSQGAEIDSSLTYNPSSGNLTSDSFTGQSFVQVGTGITLSSSGNATYTGIVTAQTFVGDGSGLTNVIGSGSGVVIKNNTNTVGTAGTINFGETIDVSAISGGSVTVGVSTSQFNVDKLNVSGISTFNTDVEFKGSGANILFDASQDQLEFSDSASLTFGNHTGTGDYNISYVNGADFTILGMNGGSGDLVLGTFASGTTTKTLVSKRSNNALELYFANNKKLETTNTGVTVTGTVTATAFAGDGSNLTGISGGTNVGITTNLSGSFTASAGTAATINTLTGYSANDLVVEYTIYIKNGSDFQTQKLLAMRDGTTIHSTQFAVMFSSSLLVQCDATISSGNILLRATPETGVSGSTTYKVKREVM